MKTVKRVSLILGSIVMAWLVWGVSVGFYKFWTIDKPIADQRAAIRLAQANQN